MDTTRCTSGRSRGWVLSLPTRGRSVGRVATRGGAAAAVAIPPSGVAGLTFWVKSDTQTYQDSGGTVPATANGNPIQRWDSQAGGGWQLNQATPGSRPTMQLAQVNGLPGVRYEGTDDFGSSGVFSNFVTASLYVIYTVYRVAAVDTGAGATYNNDAVWSDAGGYLGQHLKSDGKIYAYNYAAGDHSVALPFTMGAWMATRQRHVGGNLYLKRTGGGAEVSTTSGSTTTEANVFQVGRGGSAFWFAGDVAELFIYNVNVAAADLDGLDQYVAARYGLAW
jgi:hypothetical protein